MIDYEDVVLQCTICSGDYNPGTEGGRSGYIGILPVNFCPTCVVGIMDFAEKENKMLEVTLDEITGSEATYIAVLNLGVIAAKTVVDRWEHGDLAEAVRNLDEWASMVEGLIET